MRLVALIFAATTLLACKAATPANGTGTRTASSGTSGSSASSSSGSASTWGTGTGTAGSSGSASTSGTGTGGSSGSASTSGTGTTGSVHHIGHVFVIVMENHNWAQVEGNTQEAPYINNTLLKTGAYCEQYYDSGVHPSLPNYLWIEAGSNLGITSDNVPTATQASNGEKYLQATTDHLVSHLDSIGVSWRTYMERLSPGTCPTADSTDFACRHNPVLYFSDVVGDPAGSNTARCTAHVKPYSQLATDLQAGTVAQYNFITPDLCDDMHNSCGGDKLTHGDTWLSQNVPAIVNSAVFKRDGALFITWDESENDSGPGCNHEGCPIGMIVLSPFAKAGYASSVHLTHSSLLRSIEEIFGVTPFTRDAASANDLSDLFTQFP